MDSCDSLTLFVMLKVVAKLLQLNRVDSKTWPNIQEVDNISSIAKYMYDTYYNSDALVMFPIIFQQHALNQNIW